MNQSQEPSGPQFRGDRPPEREAVTTTIVGGRPPGSGQPVGDIPRGIEVLVKKASVDPDFKALLLERRAESATAIGLALDPAEVMMLGAVPGDQLEAIIARTTVPKRHRRAFLGTAAGAMLAALGLVTTGCIPVTGTAPDPPPDPQRESGEGEEQGETTGEPGAESSGEQPDPGNNPTTTGQDQPDRMPVTDGIRPDRIPAPGGARPDRIPAPQGIRPDRIPPSEGIRPDRVPQPPKAEP